jgi:hypothetical protein
MKFTYKTLKMWQSSDTEEQQYQIKIAFKKKLKADQIQGMLATIQYRLKHANM